MIGAQTSAESEMPRPMVSVGATPAPGSDFPAPGPPENDPGEKPAQGKGVERSGAAKRGGKPNWRFWGKRSESKIRQLPNRKPWRRGAKRSESKIRPWPNQKPCRVTNRQPPADPKSCGRSTHRGNRRYAKMPDLQQGTGDGKMWISRRRLQRGPAADLRTGDTSGTQKCPTFSTGQEMARHGWAAHC